MEGKGGSKKQRRKTRAENKPLENGDQIMVFGLEWCKRCGFKRGRRDENSSISRSWSKMKIPSGINEEMRDDLGFFSFSGKVKNSWEKNVLRVEKSPFVQPNSDFSPSAKRMRYVGGKGVRLRRYLPRASKGGWAKTPSAPNRLNYD